MLRQILKSKPIFPLLHTGLIRAHSFKINQPQALGRIEQNVIRFVSSKREWLAQKDHNSTWHTKPLKQQKNCQQVCSTVYNRQLWLCTERWYIKHIAAQLTIHPHENLLTLYNERTNRFKQSFRRCAIIERSTFSFSWFRSTNTLLSKVVVFVWSPIVCFHALFKLPIHIFSVLTLFSGRFICCFIVCVLYCLALVLRLKLGVPYVRKK